MMKSQTLPISSLAVLLLSMTVLSEARAADEVFAVVDASFVEIDSNLSLNMRVESNIPDYITIAMDQGFAVPFLFEVEIRERKTYWLDKKVIALKQQYLLHYLPILESYIVIDKNVEERTYFRNRETAMYFISRVLEYPLLNVDNLRLESDLYARVRFGIDADELPLPLKSSSLWDNDWDLKSDWFEWSLEAVSP